MLDARLLTLLLFAVFVSPVGRFPAPGIPDDLHPLRTSSLQAQRGSATKPADSVPSFVETLRISPSQVLTPEKVMGVVTLYSAAPPTGTVVMLSSNSSLASTPGTVSVPGGAKSASFPITTASVAADTPITITAATQDSKALATLLLLAPNLASVKLSTSSVTNTMASATITLTGEAPPGGIRVELTTSHPAASLPREVLIPAGADTATCPLTPSPVEEDTPVTVSAACKGIKSSATITIRTATLSTLRISPSRVPGQSRTTGSISLNGVAPASGMTVNLSSSSTLVSIPAQISLPSGAKGTTFPVTTVSVPEDTPVVITASHKGIIVSASTIVEAPVLSTIRFEHTKVSSSSTATGVVTLSSPAPAGGLRVVLHGGDSEIRLPDAVVVPQGSRSANFNVTFQKAASPRIITVTATAKTTCSAALLLEP